LIGGEVIKREQKNVTARPIFKKEKGIKN